MMPLREVIANMTSSETTEMMTYTGTGGEVDNDRVMKAVVTN
jgi:hypothetical protein